MKKLFYLIFCLLPAISWGQAADNIQEGVANFVAFDAGRLMQLAEAFPEDKYDYTPEEGVRTFATTLLHTAAANYYIMSMAGATIPDGVNPMTMESDIKGKDAIMQAVQTSFDWVQEQVKAVDDSALNDEVQFPFPGEYNKQSAILLVLEHVAEHRGQLVAYARSNGVTPPWSVQGGE